MSAPSRLNTLVGEWLAKGRTFAGRRLRAYRLARSGVVDREYYQAQTGRRFSGVLAVATDYLARGAASGYSVHPLFEPELVDRRRTERDEDALVDYLRQRSLHTKVSPHPLFDLRAARRELESRDISTDKGVWLAWVRGAAPDTPVPVPSGMTPVSWGEVRAELLRIARLWREPVDAATDADAAPTPSRPGLTSIVVVASAKLPASLGRLSLLGEAMDERELVVVGVRRRSQFRCLSVLALTRPVTVLRGTGGLAALWNAGVAASSGDRLVLVSPAARLRAQDLSPLIEALADPGVAVAQPLNENPDMTVRSAGAYFAPVDVVPTPLLSGHPVEDALRLGRRAVPAALSGVIALRREVFAALGGLGEEFGASLAEVDLSLRAAEADLGRTLLVPEARCTVDGRAAAGRAGADASARALRARWPVPPSGSADCLRAAGFVVTGHRVRPAGESGPEVYEPELARPASGLQALPSLRWTIDTAVTAGSWAQAWGDWHFAASLARALRRLGQQVAVDARQARERDTRRFDDVILTLRGLDPVEPRPGPVNVLWVISHPEDVSAAEAGRHDAVFAASVPWAAERSVEWGLRVDPLLQCTDAEYFNPERADGPRGHQVVFVGNARRGAGRPIVDHALRSGVPLDLYGTGWQGAARRHVVAEKVPNDEVGRIYGRAGVVLNDHWEDMREAGFVSNRLFDAVACGARVLSDPVAGAGDLFGGSVLFCETDEDVERVLAEPFDEHWPTEDERRAIARRVVAEHSFDQRAEVLLARAVEVLRQR